MDKEISSDRPWAPVDTDLATVLDECDLPLERLAEAAVPAIVLRGVLSRQECQQIVDRLTERGLMYDPQRPVPKRFLEESIPEGYFRKDQQDPVQAGDETLSHRKRRIDVGTSLGYRGVDRQAFFEHAGETNAMFQDLFIGLTDPVRVIYDSLQQLAGAMTVCTAQEPDGKMYGAAIFRVHYGDYNYPPHFDSVRLREQRSEYAIYQYDHQFAGVLVLQNSESNGRSAQCIIHRCLWTPQIDPSLRNQTFHQYAEQHGIESCRVELEPGDLYFFNTRCIHEVPGVDGHLPRIVLATFIGYSAHAERIMVWS